jgi:hypothetical protein
VTGTPRPCYRSISIVADGRLGVCDGAHWAFVMKKVRVGFWGSFKRRYPSWLGWTLPFGFEMFYTHDSERNEHCGVPRTRSA